MMGAKLNHAILVTLWATLMGALCATISMAADAGKGFTLGTAKLSTLTVETVYPLKTYSYAANSVIKPISQRSQQM